MEMKDAVVALAAMAQETRLAVFRALVVAGPEGLSAGRIADALAVAPATLSFHLKELDRAGLVTARQDGRYVLYSANFAQMNALLGFLTANCCRGEVDDCAPAALCCPPDHA
ncbi:metalloregulator ArsR/SmtB family transcription factor [Nevskia sp.]|uniref:ArsR/SmtB family transcription factor n=1 Tax=Nevskia sp. TaxID=1929292 RepID=UPI0025DBC833|nr:metalloregulator ArsR/SmtB family transcription factor [Nevskia sp.]